ncbi:hypothetical protein D3C71_1393750 [compost metagenome]
MAMTTMGVLATFPTSGSDTIDWSVFRACWKYVLSAIFCNSDELASLTMRASMAPSVRTATTLSNRAFKPWLSTK